MNVDSLKEWLRGFTTTWLNGSYESLFEYFDRDVVMLMPGSSSIMKGVETMVHSYRHFGENGRVHEFQIKELDIFELGEDTSVCHLHFFIDYEIEGGRFQEEGVEILVVGNLDTNPRIKWRTQSTIHNE